MTGGSEIGHPSIRSVDLEVGPTACPADARTLMIGRKWRLCFPGYPQILLGDVRF